MERVFSRIADSITRLAGSPFACLFAVVSIAVWLVTGPILHFSTQWQLYANTGTTIITYLIVFFIQYSSNHSTAAILLKLDALIKHNQDADNKYLAAEDLSEAQLREMKKMVKGETSIATASPCPENPAS